MQAKKLVEIATQFFQFAERCCCSLPSVAAAAAMDNGVDARYMTKMAMYGNTIKEVGIERERQTANAPPQPTMLSNIIMEHMVKRDNVGIEQRLRANAKIRAQPQSRRKVPTTEIEKLVAMAPKSSAQEVGFHVVPEMTPVTPPAGPPRDELARMRTYFPRSEAGAIGFHRDFEGINSKEAKDATAMLGGLTAAQIQADPQLAKALATIKQRTTQLGQRYGHDGVPRGVKTLKR